MKFGETGDAIYAYSFPVEEGYSTPSWPFDQTQKYLFANSGALIDVIDFGARQHRTAEFNLVFIPRADYYTLKAWFDTKKGDKIRVTLESSAENVFGEQLTNPVAYAYLLDYEQLGEVSFTATRSKFGFSMKLDYAGTTSSSIPNEADTSQYDFVHVMDCARVTAGCSVANKAALDAITTKPGGSRGLTLDTLKIYFWNQAKAIWEYQYTLPANTPSMGLKHGVFRWSEFSDISGSASGVGGEDIKAGIIVKGSIKFPRYSVDARQGPAIEHPEGYSLSAANNGKLWKYPLDNNLAFYGAFCKLYVYDRQAGVLVLIRSGYNNKNSFDYSRLEFQVEPGIFLQNKSFPVTTVGKTNFPSAGEDARGKPVMATFGRWDKGWLQTVAFNMDVIRFSNGRRYLNLVDWDNTNRRVTLDLDSSFIAGIMGYAIGSYPVGNSRLLYAAIFAQDEQPDQKKLRKVTAIFSPAANQVRLTLNKGFATVPSANSIWILYLANNELVIEDDACIGLRTAGYLKPAAANGERIGMELYAKADDGNVRLIPPQTFNMVEDGKENRLTIDSNYLSMEENSDLVTQESFQLQQLAPSALHNAIDTVVGTSYTHYPFGFSPDGVESNELGITPEPRAPRWTYTLGTYQGVIQPGEGRIIVGFSGTFATIAWSRYYGAVSYRLTRYVVSGYRYSNGALKNDFGKLTPALKRDTTFGASSGCTRTDGSVATPSGGYITVADDSRPLVLIDASVVVGKEYVYCLEPEVDGRSEASVLSNSGKILPVPAGGAGIIGIPTDQGFLIVWPVPTGQSAFTVTIDDVAVAGHPVTSSTQGWYQSANTLSNGQSYRVKLKVKCLAIGAAGDKWVQAYGVASDHGVHWLMHSGGDPAGNPYSILRDSSKSNLEELGYERSWAVVIKKRTADGIDVPAAGVVYSELFKVDHEAIGDLSGAKNVRLLRDMVVRNYFSINYSVPLILQVQGIKRDKTIAHICTLSDLQGKAPTEGGSYGAFWNFLNLPTAMGGDDANYETEAHSSNVNGLYTGKDLWKLPDRLFEDDAFEWKQIEYIIFSVTNAAAIAYEWVAPSSRAWHLGIGGPPGQTWGMVRKHKPGLFLEYTRIFEGGIDQPRFSRIDGGIKDDAAGTVTGTANKIIEKARHITDYVTLALTGQKPLYIGDEMKSRDSWIWRWQAKESKPLTDTVQTFLDNLWAIMTISPDDRPCIRTLNIDEPNNTPVFAFTSDNIIKDSLSKDGRRRNEIFQEFLLKFNIEPSVEDGKATEEMRVGWDLANSKPIFTGYSRMVEDASGNLVDLDGMDGMDSLVHISTQLYAAGVAKNEFGTDPADPKIFEMFYRPTKPSKVSGQPIEKDLPNLLDLWPDAKSPKMAMQDLTRMVVRYLCLDAWYFQLSTSMKNLIYNPAITGLADELGTPDHRLKLGDLVTVADDFYTHGQALKGFVLDIELAPMYDGYATLHVFCPRPPGQFGTFVDKVWDAGGPGPRNEANFLFKGTLYGLLSENGTFADAGGIGARNENNMKFPDGSFADPLGSGSGKA